MGKQFWLKAQNIDSILSKGAVGINRLYPTVSDKYIEKYLWHKLTNMENAYSWFLPLYENDYFRPGNYPKPTYYLLNGKKKKYDEIWQALFYLEKVAQKNQSTRDENVNEALYEIITDIINYKKRNISIPTTVWSIVKILSCLPINYITRDHIDYIFATFKNDNYDHTLPQMEVINNLIPRLVNEKEKYLLTHIAERMLDYKIDESNTFENIHSVFKEYPFGEIEKHLVSIAQICGIDLFEAIINKIKNINNVLPNSFLLVDDIGYGYSDRYEDKIYKYIKTIIDNINSADLYGRADQLIKDKSTVMRKLALYTIEKHYKELKDIFWKWTDNPLKDYETKRQVFLLLHNNKDEFTDDELNKILYWIKVLEFEYKDITPDQARNYTAYEKKQWLSGLMPFRNDNLKKYYEELDRINPAKPEHQFYKGWMGPVTYGGPAPINDNFFKEHTIEEIINEINSKDKSTNFSRGELLISLRRNIKADLNKYINDYVLLNKFDSISYVAEYFWALKELWVEKIEYDWEKVWGKVFEAMEYYSRNIIDGKYEKQINAASNLGYSIAELIKKGVESDEHCIDIKYIVKSKAILLKLADHYKKEKYNEVTLANVLGNSLNSTKGEIYRALIFLSLFDARKNKPHDAEKWDREIKNYFESLLTRVDDETLEYSVTTGEYLPNLHYLDKKWVNKNIKYIFPKKKTKYFIATMIGYLTHYSVVYKEIFNLLNENGVYSYTIKKNIESDMARNGLVGHICLAYNEGWVDVKNKNNLMVQLIHAKNEEDLKNIINNFWRYAKEDKIMIKIDITKLWKLILDITEKQIVKYNKVRGNLIELLQVIKEIDEDAYKLSIQTVSGKNINVNFRVLITGIQKHIDKQPEKAGKILLKATQNKIFANYEDEKLTKVINLLYKKGYNKIADEICNIYGANGFYFVGSLYANKGK